jgi:trk system potassium uptake protein TrkH
VVGTLPFLLVAWTVHVDPTLLATPDLQGRAAATLGAFRNPLNALFESMSGFTGTGLTMTDDESALPHTLQWWRSFSEWVGGVGVIVLTTAILARPGSGSLTLYESEARSERIHPSVVSTVRTIWWIFLLFTFLAVCLLWLAGMPAWDAVNHAMTGLSTGGFSVTDDSIAAYDSPTIEYALWPVMVMGSVAFPVHYLVLRGDLRNVYADLQTRWVFVAFGLGAAGVSAWLLETGTYESARSALRYGGFQFVSAMSCTGFQSAPVGRWPALVQLVLSAGMVVGAAAGSTAGGVKLVRLATLVKGTAFRVRGVFYPANAVRRFRFDGRTLSDTETSQEFEEAAIVAFLWVAVLAVATAILLVTVPATYTVENVLFEVASTQGNVGLSTGITGPDASPVVKATFLVSMWMGRLEIIPVLVALRAALTRGDGR